VHILAVWETGRCKRLTRVKAGTMTVVCVSYKMADTIDHFNSPWPDEVKNMVFTEPLKKDNG